MAILFKLPAENKAMGIPILLSLGTVYVEKLNNPVAAGKV